MASGLAEPEQSYGRRCAMGCQTWPLDDKYRICPQCHEPTRRYRGVVALDSEAAESVVNHIDFEAFYDEWCERNDKPHD